MEMNLFAVLAKTEEKFSDCLCLAHNSTKAYRKGETKAKIYKYRFSCGPQLLELGDSLCPGREVLLVSQLLRCAIFTLSLVFPARILIPRTPVKRNTSETVLAVRKTYYDLFFHFL
jgi:hypothetical protein